MSRITGTDAANLIEAYNAVYAPQEEVELTEEQVQEDFENWVNSLVEEGHDLSEYTWEDMYEQYLSEAGNPGGALSQQQRLSQSAQNYARTSSGGTLGAGGGQAAMRALQAKGVDPKSAYARVYSQGEKNIQQAGRQPAQSTGMYGRYAPPSMQQRTPAPAAPARPAAPAIPAAPAARPAARPVAQAAKPVSTPTPAATPATPATPAAPARTFNPLMQRTFGYQTGNAPDQVAAASAGKPVPSGTALGSAADQDVRKKLNLPAKNLNQDLDLFDIIKGHLLGEGYADTEEAALQIMANMSEEWKQSILEAPMNPAELERIAQQASTEVTGKRKKPKMKRPAGMRE